QVHTVSIDGLGPLLRLFCVASRSGVFAMSDLRSVGVAAFAASVGLCTSLHAQSANQPNTNQPTVLPDITVTATKPPPTPPVDARTTTPPAAPPAQAPAVPPPPPASATAASAAISGIPPVVDHYKLPQGSFSITAEQIDETVNLKDAEDAI